MLYKIKSKKDFKNKNLENWDLNSDFWLEGKMRHLNDVYDFTGKILRETVLNFNANRKLKVLDLGSGEGWIFRLIKEYDLNVEYTGVDFNKTFINFNNKRYGSEGARFIFHDLENEPPAFLQNYADIAINFFNFFEIPEIEKAFHNVSKMIAENGILIVVSIDPIMQLLAVSNTFQEFKDGLIEYEKFQSELGYDKDIDIGDKRSGRIYKSILYSTAKYVELAKQNGLKLFDYKEVIKTGNFVPQIYQYIFFKK